MLEWNVSLKFKFTGSRSVRYTELILQQYLDCHVGSTIRVEDLERHTVSVYRDEEPEEFARWSVYDCIVVELDRGDAKYAMFDGAWFRVDSQFAAQVFSEVSAIPTASVSLPEARDGMPEGDYNLLAVGNAPGELVLLDQVMLRSTTATTPIEFCDIFSRSRHIVHLKRRSGSATLSHLFAQGSVSAEAFARDQGFREELRDELVRRGANDHAGLISSTRPSSEYCVVYGIIARSQVQWPPPLPFFSAVNLRHHVRRIESLGLRVALQYVRAR
jgi:uncharacterized protein (TIGR04141 family)